MPSKASISRGLPVRIGLGENEAAVFIGVSPSYFRLLVEKRIMPQPRLLGARNIWDIDELVTKFRDLPHRGDEDEDYIREGNTWHDYD